MSNTNTKIVISADVSNAENSMRSLGHAVDGMNKKFFDFSSATSTLAGSLTIVSFAGFIKSSINLQDELAVLSEKTGTSVEALAGLKYAAEQNDTSLEAVANSAKKLSSNLAATPELFKKLGITAKDSTGAMIQLADLFDSMPDGIQKSALAVKLMGKSGEEMIPFLNQGGESLRKFIEQGKKIYPATTEGADAAREFNDRLAELKANAEGFGIQLSDVLLPSLLETVKTMNETGKSGESFLAIGGAIKTVFETVVVIGANIAYVFKQTGNEIGGIAAQLAAIATGDFKGVARIGTMMKEDAAAARKELDAFSERLLNVPSKISNANIPKGNSNKVVPNVVNDILDPAHSTRSNGILGSLETDFKNSYQKKLRDLNSPSMSKVDKEYADNIADVKIKTAKAREELEKYYAVKEKDGRISADHIKDLELLDTAEKQQIANMEELRIKTEDLNSSWSNGLTVSMQKFVDEASNVSGQFEAMFTRSFKTVEDALVQFVRHGKLDFGSLADSIIEDLIRIQIKELELAMFKNMLKMFGGGGGMSMADSLGAGGFMNNSVGETLSFAGGGYTGTGPRSGGVDGMGGFMAIVHPNETVIDHAKGQRLNSAMAGNKTVINHSVINNIDSSTDRAQIDSLVRNAVMQGNVQLVDRLQRQGAL